MSEFIKSPHKVIVVHGLGSEDRIINTYKALTRSWYLKGVEPLVPRIEWKNGEDFQIKVERLVRMIKRLHDAKMRVSLVGTSAGGPLVLAAFLKVPEMINGVVTVGSPFREWQTKDGYDLEWVATSEVGYSSAFVDAVRCMPDLIKSAPEGSLQHLMTMRALKDEIVPECTSTITGAENVILPSIAVPLGYHASSIGLALARPERILNFLKAQF